MLWGVVVLMVTLTMTFAVRCARHCAKLHTRHACSDAHAPLQSGHLHHQPISQRSRLRPDTVGPNSHKPVSHRTRIQVSVFL